MPEFECQWCRKRVVVGKDHPAPEKCPACAYTKLTRVHHRRPAARGNGEPVSSSSFRLWPVILFVALAVLVGVPLAEGLARWKFAEHKAVEEIVWRARLSAVIAGVFLGIAVSAWGARRRP